MLEAESLRNPLAEAWRSALEIAGFNVVAVCERADETWLRGSGEVRSNWVTRQQASAITASQQVDTVLVWWGIETAARSWALREYRHARRILIVDTFPNASGILGALRETASSLRARHFLDASLTYSDAMTKDVRRLSFLGKLESHALVQPFPSSIHSANFKPVSSRTCDFIFTGRSDLMFSDDKKMVKDRVGPTLQRLLQLGHQVTVGETGDNHYDFELRNRGFSLYQRLSNGELLRGGLTDIIAAHKVHINLYNTPTRLLKRRVRNGMSSRFALGVCAAAPQAVMTGAYDSVRWIRTRGIGFDFSNADDLAGKFGALDLQQMVDEWRLRHEAWTAEGQSENLRRIVSGHGS
ncbi:hypothetical protein RU01_18350 [Rhodococcus sp. MEB064]|nr:hypothetical protein RU01_18350 [Rhodococcus sp. MEB064]